MRENKKGKAHRTCGRDEKWIQSFGSEAQWEETTSRPRCSWEDNNGKSDYSDM
jgi:hypothetical protein